MSMINKLMMVFLVAVAATLAACDNKGPAEKAGEKIDEGIEAVTPDKGPMESMGESMDEAYEDTKEAFE